MKRPGGNDICPRPIIHPERIETARRAIPKDEVIEDMADFFKICGDATRVKILHALFFSEMCVCDLSTLCGMSISSVSHQLSLLRRARLVRNRKEGQVVYYSLSDNHIRGIFSTGIEHVLE